MVEIDGYKIEARPGSGSSWSLFVYENGQRVYHVANYGDSEDEVERLGIVEVSKWMTQVDIAKSNVMDWISRMKELGVKIDGEEKIESFLPNRYFHPINGLMKIFKEGKEFGIYPHAKKKKFSELKFIHWCGVVDIDFEEAEYLMFSLKNS